MVWVPISTKVVVRGKHVRSRATDQAHQWLGCCVEIGADVLVEGPWIGILFAPFHPGVAVAEVLPSLHAERAHGCGNLAHPRFAEPFVLFRRIALWDHDLAELAARARDNDHVGRLAARGGVRCRVVRQGATHADRLVIWVGMHRHQEKSPFVVHGCIVRGYRRGARRSATLDALSRA